MFGARSSLCLHMCKMFLLSWKWDTSHIFFGGTLTPAMFVFARLWKSFCRPIRGSDWGQMTNKRPRCQVPVRNWVSLMWPRALVVTCYSVHVKCHGQQSEKFTASSFRRRERLAVNLIFTSPQQAIAWKNRLRVREIKIFIIRVDATTFVKLHHYES